MRASAASPDAKNILFWGHRVMKLAPQKKKYSQSPASSTGKKTYKTTTMQMLFIDFQTSESATDRIQRASLWTQSTRWMLTSRVVERQSTQEFRGQERWREGFPILQGYPNPTQIHQVAEVSEIRAA